MSEPKVDRVRAAVREALHRIAPEVAFDAIDPTAELREEIDLDSVDLLNLTVALHEALGVDIPERDSDQVETLQGLVQYLTSRVGQVP